MKLDLAAVARATGAPGAFPPRPVTGWSVDTRTQNVGDAYFALRGPNHDGHDFIAAAVEKGAAAVVCERPSGAPVELMVPDALAALQRLAAEARAWWGGTAVAVTGSAGKTTTKDAIAQLLATEIPTGRTVGNFNNHVGVPLSILRLPDGCKAAVLEMGMNHAGEIRALARIARPEIGVVTNVGYAHVEAFDSIEGVALAKRELIEELPADGVAVLNADDERVARFAEIHPGRSVTYGFAETARVRAECMATTGNGMKFLVDGIEFTTSLSGRHAVMNFLAAIAVAGVFGVGPDRLVDAVREFAPGKMRGERIEHAGMTIWNDCYNSNPDAARSMLDVLKATPARRRIAVLGEMLELGRAGAELHRQVGRYAVSAADVLIGVRGAAREMTEAAVEAGMPADRAHFFETPEAAGECARALAEEGDALLFKGSRGVRVERALETFLG
jgi:UDP-N-acetylmuramoyl-tripeptide--D-alanyl-D-alanine ligase